MTAEETMQAWRDWTTLHFVRAWWFWDVARDGNRARGHLTLAVMNAEAYADRWWPRD